MEVLCELFEVVVAAVVDYALASGTMAYLRLNLASMLSR